MNAVSPEAMQAAFSFLSQFFGPSDAPTNQPGPPPGAPAGGPPQSGALRADLALQESTLHLNIAVPGLASSEALTLRLLTPTELLVEAWLPPPPGLTLQSEIPTGLHSRLFQLPAPVSAASLVSSYANGILSLTFARAPA